MILLGIDFGLSKTGVAKTDGNLAEPLTVIHEKNIDRLAREIETIALKEEAEKIVIGIPEGEMVVYVNELGEKLKDLGFEVEFHDETLSTYDAKALAIEAGMPQQKRRTNEDAIAASVMLQSYLDGN